MLESVVSFLYSFASILPLWVVVMVVAFIDEWLPPVPIPPPLLLVGSLARSQDVALWGIGGLAFCSAIGRTIGAAALYAAVQKVDTLFVEKYGRYVGLTPEHHTQLGERLGKTAATFGVLLALRSSPITSNFVVTTVASLFKLPQTMFLTTVFIGALVRDGLFLYVGYVGSRALQVMLTDVDDVQFIVKTIAVTGLIVWLLFYLYRRYQRYYAARQSRKDRDAKK